VPKTQDLQDYSTQLYTSGKKERAPMKIKCNLTGKEFAGDITYEDASGWINIRNIKKRETFIFNFNDKLVTILKHRAAEPKDSK